MTKSSVNRKLSRYGERFNLRFHIKEELYHLVDSKNTPMLIAVFYKTDGDLAERTWKTLEDLYKENINLKKALYSAEEDYIRETYQGNSIDIEKRLLSLNEEFEREYWND